MNRGIPISLLLAALLTSPMALNAAETSKTIRLASLHWSPYVGPELDRNGWIAVVAETAARQAGYHLAIDYFPWTRAIRIGQKDGRYAGYFPAYYTEERARTCHLSRSLGNSTLGLAHLETMPLHWHRLSDLASSKIAVVAGYSNGAEFDALVKAGKVQVDASPNDMLNLRKLLAHRVDAVAIDRLVLRYLLATTPDLGKERARIVFHEKPLAELTLHVCFQRTPRGQAIQQAFDKALQTLPLHDLENTYFQGLERGLTPNPP